MSTHSREPKNQSAADLEQFDRVAQLFESAPGSVNEKLDAFPVFATRQAIAKFVARYEIFKQVLEVNGSIVECGVLHGGGLLTWAKLSTILEPAAHPRKVIGFDTFEGFPEIHDEDRSGSYSEMEVGGLTGASLEQVQRAVEVFDLNRPIAHIPKVDLVAGDIRETAPAYVESNPHLVVAMLYLDLDLYEPTKAALEAFLPRMPKGGVIAFDELNADIFPGETRAVDEVLGLNKIRIRRFPFDSYVSYCVLE
jgi:hypothetical protein